jgi:hypothetical protein
VICDITDLPDHNLRGEPPKCGSAPAGGRVRRDRRVPRSRGQGLRARRWNARRGSCRHGAGSRGCLAAFGAKPVQRRSGFSQIRRRQERCRRSASLARSVVSSRSSPSVIRSTTAPCPSTRRDQSRLKAWSDCPIRVPPDQSCACAPAAFRAASTSRARRCRVMLVRRVPKVKAWTRAQPCPLRLATAWTKCRTMRE